MNIFPVTCPMSTNAEARWPYQQYYFGEKDQEERRNGHGENHWTGAESLEWYDGKFVQDTMHGQGEYRWRYKGPEGLFITYEGYFFGNRMHGYGVLSYPDGRVFKGLLYNNMRWGPGVESNTNLEENVGIWRSNQLIRLTWRPKAPSVTLDFNFGAASLRTAVESHRTLLATRVRNVGEVNSAIELLKQNGAEPILASAKWSKLYPKYCTDLESRACHVKLFEHEYYKKQIVELEKVDSMPLPLEDNDNNSDENTINATYYAWNNSEMMFDIMKHSFKHEQQRQQSGINLASVLSGLRSDFKHADKHEYDCRNLIMASYLGYIHKVAQLINQENVHPDVADMLGNTPLMYAACGNQVEIIHFLVEAGANVNNYNDSCCTPLALALVRFACMSKDIPSSSMVLSLTPPPQSFSLPLSPKPSEWHITREMASPVAEPMARTGSKTKLVSPQKSKASATNIAASRKSNGNGDKIKKLSIDLDDSLKLQERKTSPKEKVFNEIHSEFLLQAQDVFCYAVGKPNALSIPYLFDVSDIAAELDEGEKDDHKNQEKSKPQANVTKNNTKPSQVLLHSPELDSLTSADRAKNEMLEKTMATIVQLLSDGAVPRLVRCPQSALRIAVVSGSADLVRLLLENGANVNETCPEAHDYSTLDMAILGPLTYENLALIRTILEYGGTANHRLKMQDPEVLGPTLLHVVLAKHVEDGVENEVYGQVIELLLEYNARPLDQFKGSSAVDVAMSKNLGVLDIFVRSPRTDLNAIINENNQTVLVRMFAMDFFKNVPLDESLQMLSNLLLYGADPLVECQNGEENFENLFVFAKQNITAMEKPKGHTSDSKNSKNEKGKAGKEKIDKIKSAIGKKDDQSKQTRTGLEELEDYKQAFNLVKDCVRILHVRWIQAKLLKELLRVVEKYEHRQWNMILPEHKNKRACGLWLSMPRCLEIWDLLKTRRPKKVTDRRLLKHILSMIHFYCNRVKTEAKHYFKLPVTAKEKDAIDHNVCCIIQEHKAANKMESESTANLCRPYVKPELARRATSKFQICFECCLPLPEDNTDNIKCSFCKQVVFCSLECMKENILEQNVGVHPCSEDLKDKYFPSTTSTASSSMIQT